MKFYWQGCAVSVNKWTGIRIIKKGGKQIPMVYKTPAYKTFIDSLATVFQGTAVNAAPMFAGYVDIEIRVSFWKMRDSDSSIKPICDAMEQAGLVKNDRYIRNIKIERTYHKRDEYDDIGITIMPVAEKEDFELTHDSD